LRDFLRYAVLEHAQILGLECGSRRTGLDVQYLNIHQDQFAGGSKQQRLVLRLDQRRGKEEGDERWFAHTSNYACRWNRLRVFMAILPGCARPAASAT
jgi:hypothetical protein